MLAFFFDEMHAKSPWYFRIYSSTCCDPAFRAADLRTFQQAQNTLSDVCVPENDKENEAE